MAEIAMEPVATEAEMTGRDERGMTTAEYAVGIVAACALASVLVLVVRTPEFQKLVAELVTNILRHFIKA